MGVLGLGTPSQMQICLDRRTDSKKNPWDFAQLRVKDLFQEKAQRTEMHRGQFLPLCARSKMNSFLPALLVHGKNKRKEKTGAGWSANCKPNPWVAKS